jgi:hypothetical protein
MITNNEMLRMRKKENANNFKVSYKNFPGETKEKLKLIQNAQFPDRQSNIRCQLKTCLHIGLY